MTLPLHLQMEIDIHAQMHSREIAEGFAKLRAKLPPDPGQSLARLQQALMNASVWPMSNEQMNALLQNQPNPLLQSLRQAQNASSQYCGGLWGNAVERAFLYG